MTANKNQKKTYNFKSETKELLHLMIHSLYSNREIFFRELISNAADAIDKLKFNAISAPELYENDTNLYIRIFSNKNNNSLTISDNGIGMKYEDIINNLGTIAKSGTKEFIKTLNKNNKIKNDLIGQFGVGFYSSFIVSEKVIVKTRFAGLKENQGVIWTSDGKGTYEVNEINKKERGTEVTLYLTKDHYEFLETWKIQNTVSKYSDHISIPIELNTYDEKEKTYFWKQINQAEAIWTRPKSEITELQYKNFYKKIANDTNDPLTWTHNKVEGNQEYTILLFIPSKSAWDIWNRDNKHGLKLYVKRVYIMDDAEQFLPNYLRFVKGIIDSNDLPLNVSREILQDHKLVYNLKKSLTKKVLQVLHSLSQNVSKYEIFWKQFGLILKEGPAEDSENRTSISNLIRFSSLLNNTQKPTMSLENYVKNMKQNQEKIYFITADNYASAVSSPHLEFFKKKNIDVLILSDKIDEWMMNYLIEYNEKKFQSVSKDDKSIEKLVHEQNSQNETYQENMNDFLNRAKKTLSDKIKDIRFTHKLTNTPAMVITDSNEMSTQMAKLFSAAGQTVPTIKYILEINPNHLLIKKINNEKNEKKFKNWINFLFEQCLLAEKNTLDNPNKFIARINDLLINN
ncbi:chaperone protein HtpG [Buchnera aphidicola str. Bp (Baizongia pistaciae)]|uniref:Chaperone protein HtpG n=1 Tax=Buchnera aphidicola subsp. Baizongia pistaciae (strain Bp) TaxID=224915 RepID=HTPG_BUCBP|nr:molecular chaperone HtpG [Buchnera aphidicola]Q89A93.1 RecName: Full=Chaperone protein HtpG; AltName: Full=Heat shock protein HtpG; AltName: Full=High temperature protein G [Buchnera aphidicola str. Bp (Baizongia pistaciae)]AAO27137.1 chaperone protein HtpG [Buchnera aphidicola str. Bp (Baizongia pistaciae)]